MNETGVSCFSELPGHPLMWAHYAESHKGVCLAFSQMLFPEWMAQNVVYSEHRPRVNLADPEFGMGLVHALLHKSHHWAYEQERRMINWREPPGWRAFPPQALKCIIMGAKISSEDEAFVRGLVTRRPHLLVYRTKVDAVDYKLVFEPAD